MAHFISGLLREEFPTENRRDGWANNYSLRVFQRAKSMKTAGFLCRDESSYPSTNSCRWNIQLEILSLSWRVDLSLGDDSSYPLDNFRRSNIQTIVLSLLTSRPVLGRWLELSSRQFSPMKHSTRNSLSLDKSTCPSEMTRVILQSFFADETFN